MSLLTISCLVQLSAPNPGPSRLGEFFAVREADAVSPHGTYTTSSQLCQSCHLQHDAREAGFQHNGRSLRVEEDNGETTYTGSWVSRVGGSRSASASVESSQAGDRAQMAFSASRISWLATKTPQSGRARVYLDGQTQADIDLYDASTTYQVQVWQKTFGSGEHIIEVRVLGTKSASSSGFDVDVDAFDLDVPKVMLARNPDEKAVCYSCHNGTGASTDIAKQFDETTAPPEAVSKHPVPGGQVLCSDCHSPHASAENWDGNPEDVEVVRLLRAIFDTFLGFVVDTANNWLDTPEPANVNLGLPEQRKLEKPYEQCAACHGRNSALPGGDVVRYFDSGGSKHDATGSVPPDSKAAIACTSCHEWHASTLPKLLQTVIAGNSITANDNQVCYSCHIEPEIASYDTSVGGDIHGATESTQTSGSPGLLDPYYYRMEQIKCTVCHDTHGSPNLFWTQTEINGLAGISIDGTETTDRAEWESYCAACHTYVHETTTTYDLCVTCHFHGAGSDSSAGTGF